MTYLRLSLLLFLSQAALAQEVPPRPSFSIEDNRLALPTPIAFEGDTDKLSPSSEAALTHIKAFLDDKPSMTLVRLEDHVAGADLTEAGVSLTQRRAMAVAKALVSRGVDCKRLLPVGFGEGKPVANNDSAEGRAKNTRVELVIATLRGLPIGGMPIDGGGMLAGDACAP